MIYAGIGSRSTPSHVLNFMSQLGTLLATAGWTLRSGHAYGADAFFEQGCINADGTKEIYLPWPHYNLPGIPQHGEGYYPEPAPEAFPIAKHFHPNWNACSDVARKLHARNSHIVAGWDLNTPVDLVICWTPDGHNDNRASGGTGQAIRIANHLNIPVFNLKNRADQDSLEQLLKDKGILK